DCFAIFVPIDALDFTRSSRNSLEHNGDQHVEI
ncbi:MAG: hypothetical protein ACI9XZ_004492, partial [Alphaproteobacteria bacterium]